MCIEIYSGIARSSLRLHGILLFVASVRGRRLLDTQTVLNVNGKAVEYVSVVYIGFGSA